MVRVGYLPQKHLGELAQIWYDDSISMGSERQEPYKKEISIMRDKVLEVLEGEVPEIDFLSSDELVDDGILDSLTLTGIIAALTMEFGITIPYEEIIEENFNSVDGIASMVERLMD